MPQRAASPPLAQGRDHTVYLVLDDFGELGSAFRETDPAKAHLTTIVADLLSGQYRHPLRVVAFNTAEGWARRQRRHRAQGCSLVRASWTMTCQLRCALGAGVRVRAPMTCRRPPNTSVKGSARPHARPGDAPSFVRDGTSVA
jgi:hypothetical protein